MQAGTELELVRRCQAGDANAFDMLYERHGERVWRLCARMTRSVETAEDLAQDVWLTVWQKIGSFRCEAAFQTWLYRIVVNVCLQNRRRCIDKQASLLDATVFTQYPSPENQALGRETENRLLQALATLPDTLKLPLILRIDEDLPYADIAQVLGCTTAAVKMRIARARAILVEGMEEGR